MNKPMTPSDLDSLDTMLAEHGIGDAETIARAKEVNKGLGLFVRSLIGLDRGAAKEGFADFLQGKTLTAAHADASPQERHSRRGGHPPRRCFGAQVLPGRAKRLLLVADPELLQDPVRYRLVDGRSFVVVELDVTLGELDVGTP